MQVASLHFASLILLLQLATCKANVHKRHIHSHHYQSRSSLMRLNQRFASNVLESNIQSAGQCPILQTESPLTETGQERVQTDLSTGKRTFNARIVGIFSCLDSDYHSGNELTLDFRLAKPVIDLAVRAVNEKYPHMHFNVTYRTAPDICRHQQAVGHAADEYYVNGANYFVGPGCGESLASVGQLASYWNVPICSTGYLPQMVTARFNPLTLMQLSLSVQSVGEMLLELFQMYQWRHLVILTDQKHPLHSLIRDGLLEYFHTMYMTTSLSTKSTSTSSSSTASSSSSSSQQQQQQQQQQRSSNSSKYESNFRHTYYINITTKDFITKSKSLDYEPLMAEAKESSRIMLLLAANSTIRHLLEAARAQNMSNGQYVFIAHELFESHKFESTEVKNQADNNNNNSNSNSQTAQKQKFALEDKIEINSYGGNASIDQYTREVYHPLMTISLRIPTTPEFDAFRLQVAGQSEQEFNYRIQPSSLKSLYSLGLAAFIYDCVALYADKVDYILRQTQLGKIDGKTIFGLVAGKTFRSSLTGDLFINEAGQRVIDFTLNDFSPKTFTLEPIAHFVAIDKRLKFLADKAPHWVLRNMSTPRSDPQCSEHYCRGMDAEIDHLLANSMGSDRVVVGVWLVAIIVVSVAMTSSIIGWLVYRRFRIESELLNLWWSIKYEDILFEDEAEVACDGKRSMSSLAISNESFNESTHQHRACVGGTTDTGTAQSIGSGRTSPAQVGQQVPQQHQQVQQQQQHPNHAGTDQTNHQLHVDAAQTLSAAHSNSTLSVGRHSLGASSTAAGVNPNQAGQPNSGGGGASGRPAAAGANKLLPLLGKQTGSGGGGGGGSGSGKGAWQGRAHQSGVKNLSISSQNKNVKLRLGQVLDGACGGQGHTTKVGLYKASKVAAKHLNVRNLSINRQLLIELRQVRDLTHENLIKFIGLCPEEPNVAIVSELCTRGNLQDLLQNESIRLDWPFRFSMINDIVDGLLHLHSSPVQYHGRLKSCNCVIDNRFVVKLTDFGLPTLLAACELEDEVNPRLLLWTAPEHLRTKHPLLSGSQKGDVYSLAIIFQEIITRCGPFECEPILCGTSELGVAGVDPLPAVAPLIRTTDAGGRLVRGAMPRGPVHQQPAAPAGSAAHRPMSSQLSLQPAAPIMVAPIQPIVVQHKQRLEPEEIVNLVRMGLSPPFRPYFRPDVAGIAQCGGPQTGGGGGSGAGAGSTDFSVSDLIAIVQSCWQEAPTARPTVASVKAQIKKMRGRHLDGANLMDNLLQRMERYTDNLESLVEQKTAELMEEKKRSEEILYEMLPRFVVDQLKYGHSVTPEAYEAVTISFSDIKDFTSIAAQSSPIEVVNLLNQLYTEFDDCIARYDVYKVETIGDAYMVVSGLPVRNGDLHAKEIGEMSLALLELIRNFYVVHLPHVNLELRIGIHSGPCASGVVGTRMFRYCLFGDTVNTASRMESHGEPMKIHISEDSANILRRFGTFVIEPRGQIDIKGKGLMSTYWLAGKKSNMGDNIGAENNSLA